jgi:hypothetical protein
MIETQHTPDDYDSPWKEALERDLPDALALLFPTAFAGIDWSRGHSFLDKELQKVARDAQLGRRLADKLVRVAQAQVSSPKRQAKSPESLSHL